MKKIFILILTVVALQSKGQIISMVVRNDSLFRYNPLTNTRTYVGAGGEGMTDNERAKLDSAYNRSSRSSYLINPGAKAEYYPLLKEWQGDSVTLVRMIGFAAGSNKLSASAVHDDSSVQAVFDVNEANINVANLSNYNTLTTLTGAQVVTNKEIVRRVLTESGTSASVNIDSYDVLVLTNAAGASLTITGTPYDGQVLEVLCTTGGSITSVMVAPPTIDNGSPLVIGTYRYYRFQYDAANTTWVNVAADRITQNDYNKLFTLQTSTNPTGTITHNANSGSRHAITFTGSGGRTLAFSNITTGYLVTFYFDNTSGGAITLTLPSNGFVQNSSGVYASAASISIPVGKTSVSLNLYDGTNYWYTTSF